MNNLIDLQNQIDKLQQKAVEIKQRDFEKVVTEIIMSMQLYGISVGDIVKAKKASPKNTPTPSRTKNVPKPRKGSTKAKEALAAKFCGPNGESWTGRGLVPRWLAALIAQGHKREEFTVGVQPKLQ